MDNQEKQEIDVEQYAKDGKHIPSGVIYIITVDRHKFKVKVDCLTGKEILILAGKIPHERFQLNQRFTSGKVVKVGYEQKVCFTDFGIEKFMTIPLDQTEGGK